MDLDLGWDGGEGKSTSAAVTVSAAQSTLGKTLYINFGFSSMVSETSSHSFGWRGKEAEVDLQALTAQVRKLRVRTFIFWGAYAYGGAEVVDGVCEEVVYGFLWFNKRLRGRP